MEFRSPRPLETAAHKPEPAHTSPPEEPQPKKETPPAVQHISTTRHTPPPDKPKKRLALIVVSIVVAVLLIAGVVVWCLTRPTNSAPGIDSSKYQAVFFTNGQVYFGKLSSASDKYLKLTDIFYLQTQSSTEETDSKNPQKTASDQNNSVQLIKLGNEVHGPEDEMTISRDQILFYENLKSDGNVAKTIQDYRNKQ